MRLIFALLFGVIFTPAYAQTAPSPFEQALAQKLSREIDGSLQTSAALIAVQQDLAKAKERIKALEEKCEPKPK